MHESLRPPKIFSWHKTLDQSHVAHRPVMIASGASFTASTNQCSSAGSWPGYVYERCGLHQVIDMSFPGIGNPTIYQLILDALSSMTAQQLRSIMVVVMWNSHDITRDLDWPQQGQVPLPPDNEVSHGLALETHDLIMTLARQLQALDVPFAFTSFCNNLHDPYVHRRDHNHNLGQYLTEDQILDIRSTNFFPEDSTRFFYDYAFFNNMFEDDMYHPSIECSFRWTDEVLLPNLERLGLIYSQPYGKDD